MSLGQSSGNPFTDLGNLLSRSVCFGPATCTAASSSVKTMNSVYNTLTADQQSSYAGQVSQVNAQWQEVSAIDCCAQQTIGCQADNLVNQMQTTQGPGALQTPGTSCPINPLWLLAAGGLLIFLLSSR